MPKAPDAFRTISEAAEELDLPQHVLRHWEDTFGAIRPMRRAGGRRYYRLADLEMLSGVKALLHGERYTTKGVQKIFRDHGQGFVAEIGRRVMKGDSPEAAVAAATAAEGGGADIDQSELIELHKTLIELRTYARKLRDDISSGEPH